MDPSNSDFDMIAKWKQILADAVKSVDLQSKITPGHVPTSFD